MADRAASRLSASGHHECRAFLMLLQARSAKSGAGVTKDLHRFHIFRRFDDAIAIGSFSSPSRADNCRSPIRVFGTMSASTTLITASISLS